MDKENKLSDDYEYSVTVENVKFILYMDKMLSGEMHAFSKINHIHTYIEVFTCTEGEIDVVVNSEKVTIKANDAVIIPAGVPHYKTFSKDTTKWNATAFSMQHRYSRNGLQTWKTLLGICGGGSPHIFRNVPGFCADINMVHRQITKKTSIVPALRLATAMLELASRYNKQSDAESDVENVKDVSRSVWLENLIETNFTEDLSSAEVAKMLHVSQRQLARIIKKHYGTTLNNVLISRRLDEAAYLLKNTDLSIEKICEEIGFKTKYIFYNKFNERFCVKPGEYRKQEKGTH